MYYIITNSLEHHGIQGQKWGVRNGPPYPLSRKSERKKQPTSKTVYGSNYQNDSQTSKSTKYPSNKSAEGFNAIIKAENGIERGEWFRKARTITKDTPMFRVETSKKPDLQDKSIYVSYLNADRNMYKGPNRTWIKFNQSGKFDTQLYENRYSLKEDLNIPSRKEVRDVQRKLLEKNDDYKLAVGMTYLEKFTDWDDSKFSKEVIKNIGYDTYDDYENKKNQYLKDEKYQKEFINALKKTENTYLSASVDWTMNSTEKYRNEVISELKKRGYNAMADEASIGLSEDRQGADPLVIFDAKNTMDLRYSEKINEKPGFFKEVNTTDIQAYDWLGKGKREENRKNKW